jgi:hypothetical protein
MLFAHLKRILKLNRLRLRGPNGVRDEFHLAAAMAQNLRTLGRYGVDRDELRQLSAHRCARDRRPAPPRLLQTRLLQPYRPFQPSRRPAGWLRTVGRVVETVHLKGVADAACPNTLSVLRSPFACAPRPEIRRDGPADGCGSEQARAFPLQGSP